MADIRTIDLNLLVALDALLDTRNVTRAAERLSLTQPTVSGMLTRLRAAFGDKLFVRAQHGIVPTPRALALATPLKRLLADAAVLTAPTRFDPATARMTFTIATTDYMQLAVVAPFVSALRRQAPEIKVAVRTLTVAELPHQLARGDCDLAITIPEFAARDLQSRQLYREHYVAVAGRKTKIGTRLSLDAFCRSDHILVSPAGGGFTGPVDDALAALGRTRNVAISVPSFLVVPALLKAGDFIAVLPARLVGGHSDQLRTFRPPLNVPDFDVIAAWHPRVHSDPAHQWLRGLLVKTAEKHRL